MQVLRRYHRAHNEIVTVPVIVVITVRYVRSEVRDGLVVARQDVCSAGNIIIIIVFELRGIVVAAGGLLPEARGL